MLFSVYYVCTWYRKTENISKILSSFFFYTNRFAELVRIISTHRHTRLLACFRFSTKKTEKQEKKKKNYDVSATLLLAVATRANERADGTGATTKRKTWPTSSSNRGGKSLRVCGGSNRVKKKKEKNRRGKKNDGSM